MPQTGVTQYHAKFGPPNKCRAIKGFVVCYGVQYNLISGWILVRKNHRSFVFQILLACYCCGTNGCDYF